MKRPIYEKELDSQVEAVKEKLGEGDLAKLIRSHGTWTVDDSNNEG